MINRKATMKKPAVLVSQAMEDADITATVSGGDAASNSRY